MTSTLLNARDEMLELFRAAWLGSPESASVLVIYPDTLADVPKGNDSNRNPIPWARVSVNHYTGTQASLSGDTGRRRWRRTGDVIVQIFTPFGTGLSLSDRLSMIALAAFEGQSTPSGVWFRGVRSEEIGQDGSWFQANVIAEFTYDEVR